MEPSSEKSLIEAGSEGEVTIPEEPTLPECNVAGVAFVVVFTRFPPVLSEPRVGKFGVDFETKPVGMGGGFDGIFEEAPLLSGGIVFC